MTAAQKLAVAAAVLVAGVETAFTAAVDGATHQGVILGDVAVVGGAAGVLAFAAGLGYAHRAGELAAEAKAPEPEAPPSASAPLWEQPAGSGSERDIGFVNGSAAGYGQGYDRGYKEGYEIGYTVGAAPSTARHAAETRVDLAPVADTAVMGAVDGEPDAPADPGGPAAAEPWRPAVSESARAVQAAVEAEDLYAHPGAEAVPGWPGPGWDEDWFAAAHEWHRGRAA